jgi:predicted small lipoprotein YifL
MTGTGAGGFKLPRGLAMVPAMQRRSPLSMFALFVLLGAATCLAGCGRKSGLDLPPSASATAAPAPQEEPKGVVSPISKPQKPAPRVVPNRSLPIDVLLD